LLAAGRGATLCLDAEARGLGRRAGTTRRSHRDHKADAAARVPRSALSVVDTVSVWRGLPHRIAIPARRNDRRCLLRIRNTPDGCRRNGVLSLALLRGVPRYAMACEPR